MTNPAVDFEMPPAVMTAVKAAAQKGATDIQIIDVAEVIGITDQFILVSGGNSRQVKAITEEIEFQLKEQEGLRPERVEGLSDLEWVLLDYGDFVVHAFHTDARSYYQLERLWNDRPVLEWDDRPTPTGVATATDESR